MPTEKLKSSKGKEKVVKEEEDPMKAEQAAEDEEDDEGDEEESSSSGEIFSDIEVMVRNSFLVQSLGTHWVYSKQAFSCRTLVFKLGLNFLTRLLLPGVYSF